MHSTLLIGFEEHRQIGMTADQNRDAVCADETIAVGHCQRDRMLAVLQIIEVQLATHAQFTFQA